MNRMGARFAFRHQSIGKTHPQRLGTIDRTSGENKINCLRMTDQPRQPDGPQVDQRHAKAAAKDPEYGVFGDDPHVRPQGQLHAAGHGETFNRGDHGL